MPAKSLIAYANVAKRFDGGRVLADVRQHDATVLGHDCLPRVVVAQDDSPLEDLEAEGVVARIAAKKAQRFLATAPRQLAHRQFTQAHPRRSPV